MDLVEDEATLTSMKEVFGPNATPISKEEGEEMARKINARGYFETSSKHPAKGVFEAFREIEIAANNPSEELSCECDPYSWLNLMTNMIQQCWTATCLYVNRNN